MIDFLKRIFWLCLSIYLFYISYQLLKNVPGFAATKHAVISIVEDDIDNVVSSVTGSPTPVKRMKYKYYEWEDFAAYSFHEIHPDGHGAFIWFRDIGCINEQEFEYYYSQYVNIVKIYLYEKLPRDSNTATDAQIDDAYDWMHQEIKNLAKPLNEKC